MTLLRKGSAKSATKNGVIGVIQHADEWKSTCFMRYAALGRKEARTIVNM